MKTLEAIEADIQEIENQINILSARLEVLKEFRQKLKHNSNISIDFPSASNSRPLKIVEIIENILKESSKPMHANEIVEQLKKYGIETDKAKIVGSISNYARSNKKFKALGKNEFDLLER